MSEQRSRPPIHFVAFHSAGPAWQEGTAFFQQPGVEEHAAYYEAELDAGRLESGGPFTDSSGGMAIFRADIGQAQAEEIALADPAVRSGLLRVEVKPWLNALTRWR
jgi:uncharacterized protein YciI